MDKDSLLTVSIEPHLREILSSLSDILPTELASKLSAELPGNEIHYNLLSAVSKWTRSASGNLALQSRGLGAQSYSMVTLLAGAKTSPSSKLPAVTPPETSEQAAERQLSDRKAITAIINALLSIAGSGAAAWWAAGSAGWGEEWKVLLSLFAAAIVALSETILYMIWESKHTRKGEGRARKLTKRRKRQKDKIVNEPKAATSAQHDGEKYINPTSSAIRRRIGTTNDHID